MEHIEIRNDQVSTSDTTSSGGFHVSSIWSVQPVSHSKASSVKLLVIASANNWSSSPSIIRTSYLAMVARKSASAPKLIFRAALTGC
jgi:hypothetical protein